MLEIKPEIEASLNAQAATKGIPLDAYLQDAIEDLARAQTAPVTAQEPIVGARGFFKRYAESDA